MLRSSFATLAVLVSATAQNGISSELEPQRAFVERHCFDCHGGDLVKGKLDLAKDSGSAVERLYRLSRLRARVVANEMPPPDLDESLDQPADEPSDGPTAAERQALVTWIDETLWKDVPSLPPAPGRITVRRLNAAQWQRTVRHLFDVTVTTGGFPADDLGYGFDTVGDAMSFSTLHLEKFLAAAGEVSARVFTGEDPDNPVVRRIEAEAMKRNALGVVMRDTHAAFHSRDLIERVVQLPRDGVYRLRLLARATQAGDEPAKMALRWDGQDLEVFDVPERQYREYELKTPLTGGEHRLGLAFINDHTDYKNPDKNLRDRNLYIDWCEITGPLDPPVFPPAQRWVHAALPEDGDDVGKVRALVRELLPRVWRRPVAADEVERHAGVGERALDAGDDLTTALRLVLQAALTSPNFLFRGEVGGTQGAVGQPAPVPSVALASRLSYFVWASAPDHKLYELGRSGKLAQRDVLLAEARRLLADPRADSLATEFAAQWLELANLDDFTPDPERFGGFDDELRRSLRAETELLFLAIQRENRDVRELLDCDFTHIDGRLAAYYGMEPPKSDGHVRVQLSPEMRRRGGVLGHASILAVTSNPTRTSPVKRGKWILENLLGQPPPPPPPGNDSLPNEQAIDSSASFREQLAMHRADSKCAVCHVRMDALGLALERFDAIGRYRESDAGGVIDCSGQLPDGRTIDGLHGLKAVLVADPAFVRTFARKLFIYGIGRDPRPVDRLKLDRAVGELLRGDVVTVADLALAIVDSDAFRLRRIEAGR